MGIVIGVLPEGAKKAIIEWGLRSWDKVKWWAPKLVRFAFPKTKRSHGGPPDHRNRDVAPATSEALVPGELAKSETVEEAPASGGAIDHEPQNGRPADGEHPSGDSPLFWAKYFIGALGLFLLLYASTVLVLVIWEKTFLGLSYVALFGLGSAVVASCVLLSGLLILALVWVHSDTNARRITAHFYLVVFVLSLGGTLAVTYWTYLYPRIPTAFGGGKPYMVDVWLSGGDVPKSIGKGGSKEECEVVGKDLHCRDVALLYVDSENVILYAEKFGVFPTLVLERKVVKAIAGAQ